MVKIQKGNNMKKIRKLLVLHAVAAMLLSLSSTAFAENASGPVTLKVGLLGRSIKPVGVLVAQALGYFEEEGINVEFETVSSMNDAYLAVSEGKLEKP